MKTLYLSIILFCTFLAFFIPSISEEESITVSTDKTSYAYGGNYTVSGKVSPVLPHEVVSIVILSTSYMHPESFSVAPSSDGRYSHTLPLPAKAISGGNFTIVAQYAGVKNQTSFNYAGLPCSQQNIPVYGNSIPIIRGAPAMNPRILDSSGNAVIGPVKVGEQIQISYTLANGLNCNMPFVYIVQIEDRNGITVSLSWITGTLLAGKSFNPAQSWVPQHNGTYTAQIFTWQSLDNPSALVPPASFAFDVEPNTNFTQSSQMESGIQSKLGLQTAISNSPLKQFKSGIAAQDVKCKAGLHLMIKAKDGSPACIETKDGVNLFKRGWTRQIHYYIDKQASHNVYSYMQPQARLPDYSYDGMDKDGMVTINNETYYQTIFNYTADNLTKNAHVKFQNVTFTFPEGILNTPGGSFVPLDVKFADGFEEIYGGIVKFPDNVTGDSGMPIPTMYGPSIARNSITVIGNHMMPQAGLTIHNDKFMLLVSK